MPSPEAQRGGVAQVCARARTRTRVCVCVCVCACVAETKISSQENKSGKEGGGGESAKMTEQNGEKWKDAGRQKWSDKG